MNDPICEYGCDYLCYVCKASQKEAIRKASNQTVTEEELTEAWASYLGAPDEAIKQYPVIMYNNEGEVVTKVDTTHQYVPPFALLQESQIISPTEVILNSPNRLKSMRINT